MSVILLSNTLPLKAEAHAVQQELVKEGSQISAIAAVAIANVPPQHQGAPLERVVVPSGRPQGVKRKGTEEASSNPIKQVEAQASVGLEKQVVEAPVNAQSEKRQRKEEPIKRLPITLRINLADPNTPSCPQPAPMTEEDRKKHVKALLENTLPQLLSSARQVSNAFKEDLNPSSTTQKLGKEERERKFHELDRAYLQFKENMNSLRVQKEDGSPEQNSNANELSMLRRHIHTKILLENTLPKLHLDAKTAYYKLYEPPNPMNASEPPKLKKLGEKEAIESKLKFFEITKEALRFNQNWEYLKINDAKPNSEQLHMAKQVVGTIGISTRLCPSWGLYDPSKDYKQ